MKYLYWTNGFWAWCAAKTLPLSSQYPEGGKHQEYCHLYNDGWHKVFMELMRQTDKDYHAIRAAYLKEQGLPPKK